MPDITLSPTPPADSETIHARLRELDELKATFVALVSHELRAPVGLLNGYLDVGLSLMENGSDIAEAKEYLLTAKKQSAQLIRIVQELTDFARVQQNDSIQLAEPFTLRDCLIQVFTLIPLHFK